MDKDVDAAARALYERNVRVGPDWDQLGEVTKSVWREDVERGLKAVPAPAPASTFSDFIRNATPERKAEVYGQVMDKVVEQQLEVIERAKAPDAGSQGALF